MHLSSFLVAALSTAAAAQKVAGSDPSERPLNIQVAVSFPKSAESHPPRLTNDFNNPLNISFTNHESETLTVDFITGSFWRKALPNEKIKGKLVTGDVNVLNLAQQNVNKKVPLGHTHNVIMPAKPWLKAGEVRLELKAVVGLGGNKGRVVVPVFNQTVVVEEKEEKFLLFDLELLFLYAILASIVGGAGYFAYNKWLAAVVPKKKPVRKEEKPVAVTTATSPTGKSFDESWIPEHHVRKTVQRGRSGTPKGKRPE